MPLQPSELTEVLNALDVEINLSKKQKYLAAHRNTKLPLYDGGFGFVLDRFMNLPYQKIVSFGHRRETTLTLIRDLPNTFSLRHPIRLSISALCL